MKKFFFLVFFLFLNLQSSAKADNIKEFEIEGISIGDSLLKFVNKETILSSRKYTYADEEFYSLDIWDDSFKDYQAIQFHLKKDDKDFEIYGLSGALVFGETGVYYPQSKKECADKKNMVERDIDKLFVNVPKDSNNFVGQGDYDPEAIRQETYYTLDNGEVWLQCVTWGKKAKKKHNIMDNLRITILSSYFFEWMQTKAY